MQDFSEKHDDIHLTALVNTILVIKTKNNQLKNYAVLL